MVGDEPRGDEDRDEEGDDARDEHPYHRRESLVADPPASASATTSSPTTREPLTSTESPGWTRSGRDSDGLLPRRRDRGPPRPPRPRRRGARVRRPRPARRCRARRQALRSRGGRPSESAPSSAISPSTATVRRPSDRSTRSSSAARIDTGFAFQQSFTSKPPPLSPISSPRQRENATSTGPSASRPIARAASRALRAFSAWCRPRKANVTSRPSKRIRVVPFSVIASGWPRRTTSMSRLSTAKSSGTIATPPGGSAATSSPFASATASSEPTRSRCAGPTFVITPTDGRAISARAAISPFPAHRELDDAHLGIGLEPAERQRHAELVVVARLRRDGPSTGAADRRQDVLRRRLPGRAGDGDDGRLAAVAHRTAERRERREGVVRASVAAAPRPSASSTTGLAPADDDEEIAALRRAASRSARPSRPMHPRRVEPPRAERFDLVELERNHRRAASRRRASRATSRSSKGVSRPRPPGPARALAGHEHDISRLRRLDGPLDRRSRGRAPRPRLRRDRV